jgi:hypothetical protein
MLSGWKQFGLLSATFSGMLLTAKVFSKSEAKQERPAKTTLPLGPKTPTAPSAESAAA